MPRDGQQGRTDHECIEVHKETKERFERKKGAMDAADPHVPEMTDNHFLETLLDTLEAVENGYYSDGTAQEETQ